MISEEQLQKWERLANNATEGPWRFSRGSVVAIAKSEDKRFIAASREAVPALIAEVRRLRAELEKEANWLANELSKSFKCPKGKDKSNCYDLSLDCVVCWREKAKDSVEI